MRVIPLALAGLASVSAATFHQDILPILQKRCQSCHRPGEIGPMPLIAYRDVRPWAKNIREAVMLGKMPPWFAESASVHLSNDARLTAEEKAAIDLWVRDGAPEGDPRQAPPAVRWTSGWNITSPDFVVRMPEPVRIPARGLIDYQYVVVPLNLTQDRWVREAEIRPEQRRVVHHAVVYIRERSSTWLRGAPAGKPVALGGVTTSDILAIYTPGQPAMILPRGMAKAIPAGADLVLQVHYTSDGRAAADRTAIGLVWADEKPARRVLTLQMASTDLRIPPGEPNHRVTAGGVLPNDCLLLSMFPHMHLRGRAFEYALVEPGGRVETLLRVAPYDFYWQLDYRLARPRPLRKGTLLRCTAWFDNSARNPRNPDPSAEVGWGEQSHQEMMVGFFDVAVPVWMDKPAFFVR